MDISITLNIDDISELNEVSMEGVTIVTPSTASESWIRPESDKISETTVATKKNALEIMKKLFTSLENGRLVYENVQTNLAGKTYISGRNNLCLHHLFV